MFSLVGQEPIIFNETIEYNIKYPDAYKELDDVRRVVDQAEATEFITKFSSSNQFEDGL